MFYPLKELTSKKVKDLLADFYYQNFQEYGKVGYIGNAIVDLVWDQKEKTSESELRNKVNDFYNLSKSNKQHVDRKTEQPVISLIDLSTVQTFLDIGANKLTLINEVAASNSRIQKFIAIDVIPQSKRFEHSNKFEYYQVDEHSPQYPLVSESVDFVNISFALHHMKNAKSITHTLQEIRRVISANGRLLIWEESFEDKVEVKEIVNSNRGRDIFTNQDFTERFYKLSKDERMQFIIINDWIVNAYNDHMQWTGQWRDWNSWVELLGKNGFVLKEKYNLGLRLNGKVKQGVHLLGLFSKISTNI